ncbi:50S ribosomal protein L14e [Candidatus Woesearchaeota archaeon]|nr:50S ribosomal protein L14e [Candidatus Woesearchaeota archaeon]
MIEIGRLCVKTAGRDSNKTCVIIDVLDKNYVMIDGLTRRRKCNISHLEPLDRVIKIKKNASNEDIIDEFTKLKILKETKKKHTIKKTSAKKSVQKEKKEGKKRETKKKIKK